jgi:iron complex outermembrane receptor protein
MKIKLLKKLILPFTLLFGGFIYAQTVTGTVSDNSGPVPGVNIIVQGTTTGTQTDFDGNYSLDVGSDDAVLVFSFIGYSTQTIPVNGQSVINVTLAEDAAQLDEVVVVGYGSTTRKEVTTAVTSVSTEDFNQGTINEPTQLLQGKVAGLTAYNKGGDPNTNATIRLRGISTIGGSAEPLVIIDGVPGGDLNAVDPNDIENITVLKDGSAAAIYGTRGSSGVIIVTTKSGKTMQEARISYNGQFATSSIANQVDIMNASEFIAAGGNDLGSDTDWIDEVTRTGFSQIHNVSAVGGTEKSTYRVSANFRDTEGILQNTGFKQFNARTKLSTRLLDDKLKVDFNAALTQRDSDFGFNEALRYAVTYNPSAPIFGDDAIFPFNSEQYGGYFETLGLFDSFNPVSIANQNKNYGSRSIVTYALNFKYSFTDNLTADLAISEQNIKNQNRTYYPTTSYFRGNAVSPVRRGRADFNTNESRLQTLEAFATYNKQISDKLSFKVTAGYSYQENDFNEFALVLGDFPPGVDFDFQDQIEASQDLLEAGRVEANSARRDGDKIIAAFARVNATFDNAIYFNASLRREGSSRFGTDNQWGTFPSVAVGADLNNYLGLENVNLLKARIGYGVTGSIPPEVGLFATTFDVANGADGNSSSGTSNASRAPNPDLKWEEKNELNFGIEFANDRLSATMDIYTRTIEDFIYLADVDAALFNGIGQQYQNGGELKTNGFELTANYDAVKTDKLTWNTGIVFSTYKTTLEKSTSGDQVIANLGSPGQNSTNMILVREGEEVGQIWGPVWTGEVDGNGTPILADVNGDGNLVTDQGSALQDDADFKVLGKGLPDFEIGWTNQLTFGKWDLNAFFRGAFGHSLVNTFRAFYEPRIGSQASYNFVNTELASADVKTAQFSSHYVEKADFFKLDNLSVGYNFDIDNSYIRNIRLSLSGQNLFTITDYTGTDPEPSLQDFGAASNGDFVNATANVLAPGIDRRNSYFSSTTITLGINVNF